MVGVISKKGKKKGVRPGFFILHPRKHMLKNLKRPAGGKIVCLPEEKGSSACESVSVLCDVPGTPKKRANKRSKRAF